MKIIQRNIFIFLLFSYLLVTIGYGILVLDVDHTKPDVYDSIGLVLQKFDEGRFFHKNFLRLGNLHKHVLSLFIAPIYFFDIVKLSLSGWLQFPPLKLIFIFARSVSLLAAITVVISVYLTAYEIFEDKNVALLSSTFLVLHKDFLNQSIFATEDLLSLSLLLLTTYFSVRYCKDGRFWDFVIGWLCLGLAIGAKATAGIGVLLLIGAEFERADHLIQHWKNITAKIFFGAQLTILSFFLSTPSIFIYPMNFYYHLNGQLMSRYIIRDYSGQLTYGLHLMNLVHGSGFPLLYCLLIGFTFQCFYGWKKGYRTMEGTISIVLSLFLIFVGSWKNTLPHYVLIGVPFFCIIAGNYFMRVFYKIPLLSAASGIMLITYSIFFSWGAFIQISNDSRYQAHQWLKENVSESATLDAYGFKKYHPHFPDQLHVKIIDFRMGPDEKWNHAKRRVEKKVPDYISLAEAHYKRYLINPAPKISPFIKRLIRNRHSYYTVAQSFGPQPITDYSWTARAFRGFYSRPFFPINRNVTILKQRF